MKSERDKLIAEFIDTHRYIDPSTGKRFTRIEVEPEDDDEPVEDDVTEVLRAKKVSLIDRDRVAVSKLRNELESAIDGILGDGAKEAADAISEAFANGLSIEDALDTLHKWKCWVDLIDPVRDILQEVYKEGGNAGFAQISIAPSESMTNLVNDKAVAYAEQRSAELVGMTNIGTKESPQWVENPDAEWAITESTRNFIRETVTTAQEEGWSTRKIAQELRESEGFSDARAKMIARTETSFADNKGNMAAYRASGVVHGKEWLCGSEHDQDDECNDNEDDGVIPLDDLFSSGDDCAPAHPNCVCTTIPSTIDIEGEGEGEDNDES